MCRKMIGFDKLVDIFYPPRCGICLEVVGKRFELCETCAHKLEFVGDNICGRCGSDRSVCSCKNKRFSFRSCVGPVYYKEEAAAAVARLKFEGRQSCSDTMALLMSQTVRDRYGDVNFDLVTEVPVHRSVLRKKGYNHSALLAKGVSSLTGIPYQKGVLLKAIPNDPQRSMKAVSRKANVFGIFEIPDANRVRGKTILLCDDVMTTGATLNECAKMLKLCGAAEVYAVVFALAAKSDKNVLDCQ